MPENLQGILNTVFHDMKSPLGMMQSYTELLTDALGEQDGELLKTCVDGLQNMSESVMRLWQMICENYVVEEVPSEEQDDKLALLVQSMVHDFANPMVQVQGWTGKLVKALAAKDEPLMQVCNEGLQRSIQKLMDLYDWLLDEYLLLKE